MSGIRAQVAVKIFGPELAVLRAKADESPRSWARCRAWWTSRSEPQVDIPQVQVPHPQEAARHGLAPAEVAEALETALQGGPSPNSWKGSGRSTRSSGSTRRREPTSMSIRSTSSAHRRGRRLPSEASPKSFRRSVRTRSIARASSAASWCRPTLRAAICTTASSRTSAPRMGGSIVPSWLSVTSSSTAGQFEAQSRANRRLLILGCLLRAGCLFSLL